MEMTQKEIEEQAEDYAVNSICEACNLCSSKGYIGCDKYRCGKQAFIYGAKWGMEHAIEWHDLRKNPNDLPKGIGNYWVLDEDGDYSAFKVYVNELPLAVFDNINAVAWCELPQFKE